MFRSDAAPSGGDSDAPVVWPDPSPLSAWWQRVMRAEGRDA